MRSPQSGKYVADCVVHEMADEEVNSVNGVETPSDCAAENAQKPFLGFTGCYDHGIDTKGRMIIPAAFREALGSPFVAGLTLDMKAIALYPISEWVRQQEMLQKLLEKDMRMQKLIDRISKYSFCDSEMDAQGRLLLPGKLRNMILRDTHDVEISGARTHIRIVSAETAAQEEEEFERDVPDVLSFIAEIQNK